MTKHNNTDIQFVFFDMDGTLTKSKSALDFETAHALTQLLNEKNVGVISGADLPQYRTQFLRHLPQEANLKNLILLPTSGAECLLYRDGSWTQEYDYPLSKESVVEVKNAFQDVLSTIDLDIGNIYGEQIEYRGEQITFSALGQNAPYELKRKWDPDHTKRDAIIKKLAPLLPDLDIRIGGTTSIDIVKKGVNKAFAVEQVSKRLEIPIENMVYIGDALFPGGNDEIVKTTGIQTITTSGPEETCSIITSLLARP